MAKLKCYGERKQKTVSVTFSGFGKKIILSQPLREMYIATSKIVLFLSEISYLYVIPPNILMFIFVFGHILARSFVDNELHLFIQATCRRDEPF